MRTPSMLVAAALLALAACGGRDGEAATPTPVTTRAPRATAPATEPTPSTVPETTTTTTTTAAPAPTAPPTTRRPRARPGPDTTVCLPKDPASAADYAQVFASRARWSGGDIGATVDLGDERTLWLFGDTFVDGLGPGGSAGPMVRNSLVVQQDGCFSLVGTGTPGNRRAPLPAAAPGEWLWPTGAVVDPFGWVQVTALRMADAPGAPGWEWKVMGLDLVTLRHSDLAVVASRHAPVPQDDAVKWGGSPFVAGGHVYQYGWMTDHQVVARTTLRTMTSQPWEFLTASGWSTDRSRAVQPEIEDAPAGEFWVVPHAGGYLASSKSAEMDSWDVSTWWGPTPTGPFRHVGQAAATEGQGSPYITYAGRVTHLPGAGLVTVWSRNYRDLSREVDLHRYGPLFAPPARTAVP